MSVQATSTNRFLRIFSGPFGALLMLLYAGAVTYMLTLDPRSLLGRLLLFSALGGAGLMSRLRRRATA